MGSSSPAPTPYQPPNQAGAAGAFQQGASALGQQGQNLYNQANTGYTQLYNQALSNPYYAGAQANASAVGQAGMNFGQQEQNWAQGLQGLSSSLGQYQTGIAQTAFDPQGQLYAQQQQQNMQQANAQNAQAGVLGSPFGAGVANQANTNFNIDWQNNQQQRQLAGIQGIGQLANTQGALSTAAGALGSQGLTTQAEFGQYANQIYQGNQQAISAMLDQLVGGSNAASSQQQAAIGDQGQYLEIGQQASQGALQSWQAQQQADNAFWGGLGSLFGDVTSMFAPIKL